jgi:hypothetical protein
MTSRPWEPNSQVSEAGWYQGEAQAAQRRYDLLKLKLEKRKPIQVVPDRKGNALFAVCNDGTIWVFDGVKGWLRMPEVPCD